MARSPFLLTCNVIQSYIMYYISITCITLSETYLSIFFQVDLFTSISVVLGANINQNHYKICAFCAIKDAWKFRGLGILMIKVEWLLHCWLGDPFVWDPNAGLKGKSMHYNYLFCYTNLFNFVKIFQLWYPWHERNIKTKELKLWIEY